MIDSPCKLMCTDVDLIYIYMCVCVCEMKLMEKLTNIGIEHLSVLLFNNFNSPSETPW